MTLQTKLLTYEEYLAGPEIKARYDIVDGEMIMAPSPNVNHQTVLLQLVLLMHRFVSEQRLGRIWFAPLDVVIQREPLRTRQPDLLFVSNERAGILGPVIEGGPDLVVEVLSPANTRSDVEGKLEDYRQVGVQECWLVSPEARSVEVLELGEGEWRRVGIFGLGDQVQSQVLSGLALAVTEIFS
ncbi:MAG TPA: Uma2 family endonuclease [Dehalococcoidia bacterium]|nr:Uma2 family endonuclease [Dehalococcoidia bacterium]